MRSNNYRAVAINLLSQSIEFSDEPEEMPRSSRSGAAGGNGETSAGAGREDRERRALSADSATLDETGGAPTVSAGTGSVGGGFDPLDDMEMEVGEEEDEEEEGEVEASADLPLMEDLDEFAHENPASAASPTLTVSRAASPGSSSMRSN